MSARTDAVVHPCRAPLRGSRRASGDKSVSHRVAMLAALAEGTSTIEGYLQAEDCLNTLSAVASLGAGVVREAGVIRVTGTGGAWQAPRGVLDMGNSGTGIRLLAGLLAGQPFTSELTGDASLRSRPMGRIRAPLELMGARVELLGPGGCAPVRVTGGGLRGIDYALPVASAQVKSCVLLAGLFAQGTTRVVEPKPTRDHTERLLRAMGAPLRVEGAAVALEGAGGTRLRLRPGRWVVPGDISSAAFWMAAAAAMPGADVTLTGVGLNPRRTAFLDVLARMGAAVEVTPGAAGADWEPCGDVRVRGSVLAGTEVGGAEIPNLIDELPLVATLGCLACGCTTIRDARELRVKESDRIKTMVGNLRALGQAVEERDDGMAVTGGAPPAGGVAVDSFGDHRVAMCMAVLALFARAPVTIRGVECVATSYPGFWDDLSALGGTYAQQRGGD